MISPSMCMLHTECESFQFSTRFHGMRSCKFERLMFNKVTL
jgi:hypothetical protein